MGQSISESLIAVTKWAQQETKILGSSTMPCIRFKAPSNATPLLLSIRPYGITRLESTKRCHQYCRRAWSFRWDYLRCWHGLAYPHLQLTILNTTSHQLYKGDDVDHLFLHSNGDFTLWSMACVWRNWSERQGLSLRCWQCSQAFDIAVGSRGCGIDGATG